MKKEYILIAVLFLALGGAGGYLLSSNKLEEGVATSKEVTKQTQQEEESIGGETDKYGCMIAAGYEYDKEIGACVRPWELSDGDREGAKIAVDRVETEKAITIIEVIQGEQEGDYEVFLEVGETDERKIVIENGRVIEEGVDYKKIGLAIEKALRDKHGWEEGSMKVEVNWSDGEWARGGVGAKEGIGGAMWFAGLVDDQWQIIWDGNGTIMCTEVESFPKGVPTSLIEECFDEASNQMIER